MAPTLAAKPGGKQQRGLGAFDFGQPLFQPGVGAALPGDQGTGPAAPAFAPDGRGRGGGQSRIGRQAEVVVRAEIDEFPAVEDHSGGLGATPGGKTAAEALLVQGGQFGVDPLERPVRRMIHVLSSGLAVGLRRRSWCRRRLRSVVT